MDTRLYIGELINRLARLDGAAAWQGDLNPTQRAVLNYLGRANRFSKSPSHVAEYLGTTRGTVSQSLKSLMQKGYVSERRSTHDKRVISFDLTSKGAGISGQRSNLELAVSGLDPSRRAALQSALSEILKGMLARNNGRAFGLCKTCLHFQPDAPGGFCKLLSEPLSATEAEQICHEQISR